MNKPVQNTWPALDTALALAAEGVPIFPCAVGGKKPLTDRGFKDASADPVQIRKWGKQFPYCNFGQEYERAGQCILDIDTAKDGTPLGAQTLADLELAYGELPRTRTMRTPSGGVHKVFTGSLRGTMGVIGPGLDTRGQRSYGLVAGSVVDGKSYAIVDDSPPAPLPGWLAELTVKTHAPRVRSELTGEPLPRDALINMLGFVDPGAGRGEWLPDIAAIRAAPAIDAAGELLDDAALLEIAVAYSRGELWRGDEFKDAFPPTYTNDEDVEIAFDSLPPTDGGVGVGSLIKKACAAGYRGPIGVPLDLNEVFKDALANLPAIISDGGDAPPAAADQEDQERDLCARYPQFRPQRRSEFLDRPAPQWLYRNLLPQNANCMMVGAPGTSKSGIMLELAACAACGLPAFGTLQPIKTGCAIYVVGEGDEDFVTTRLLAWEQFHKVRLSDDRFFVLTTMPQVSAPEQFLALSAWIARLVGPAPVALIVMDTLASMAVGRDENSTKDMQPCADAARMLHKRFACTAVTLHHPSKSNYDDPDPRGSGSLHGAYDAIATSTRGKGALTIDLGILKQRAGPTDLILNLRMAIVDVGTGNKDEMTTALVPVSMSAAEILQADSDADTLLAKVIHVLARRNAKDERSAITTNVLAHGIYECENEAAAAPGWKVTAEQDARITAIKRQLNTSVRQMRKTFDPFRRQGFSKMGWAWSLPRGWQP